MAGRRHHHIWQMIQKGFSWQEKGDHHIWVYRNGVSPQQTVTRKFGVANYFYGPEGSDADSNITKFENSIQGFIQNARKMESGHQLDTGTCAALVSHLEMRSLFLREEMSRLMDRALGTIRKHMSNERNLITILSAYVRNHPEEIDDAIAKAGLPSDMRNPVKALIQQQLPTLIKDTSSGMATMIGALTEIAALSLARTAKTAHNKVLEKDFTEVERTRSHEAMTYHIRRFHGESLVLPDTTLVFFTEKGCAPLSQKDHKVEGLVIPISSSVAIVGEAWKNSQRDGRTINRALASCAYECFLSSERSHDLSKLSRRIGRNAHLVTEAELSGLMRFEELLNL